MDKEQLGNGISSSLGKYEALKAESDKFDPKRAAELQKGPMTLKRFYQEMPNPIMDDETLKQIVKAYAKTAKGYDMYSALQKQGAEGKAESEINKEDRRHFQELIFGDWRESIEGMTDEEFRAAEARGSLGGGSVGLRKFLKKHPECKTSDEFRATIESETREPERNLDYFDYYGPDNKNGNSRTWTHVQSWRIRRGENQPFPIEHRFYLNTDASDTYAIIGALTESYDERKMPYYFKFTEGNGRADSVVIYTSTEGLLDNLSVIRDLKKDRPDLAEHMHTPPILTGKIDGNIGYGAEPAEVLNERTGKMEKRSYNEVREKIVGKAVKDATIDWVMQHLDMKVSYDGKKMLFREYLANKVVQTKTEEMKEDWARYLSNDRNAARRHGKQLSEKELDHGVAVWAGYDLEDLEPGTGFYNFMVKKALSGLENGLKGVEEDGYAKMVGVTFTKKYDRKEKRVLELGGRVIDDTLPMLAPEIAMHDPTFLKDLRQRILEGSKDEGVVPSKFVFDEETVKSMKRVAAREARR